MLALNYLFAEGYISPSITMILNSISPQNYGFATSVNNLVFTIAGSIATISLNAVNQHYDIDNHPHRSGYIICAFACFAYVGAIPFFVLAGKEYSALKVRER